MTRKMLLTALGSAAAFAFVPCAQAAPVTPSLFSEGVVSFFKTSDDSQVSNPCFHFSSTNAAATCTGSTPTPAGSTLTYSTTATADYGTLKAGGQSATTGGTGSNTVNYSSASGQSDFEDSWLISGGAGTGTLALTFHLDGTYNFCAVGSGLTIGFSLVNLDGGPSSSANLISGCSGTDNSNVTLTTTFTFGTPLDFLVNLLAGSDIHDLGINTSSNIDFSDTATMNAIVVKDAGGNVIPFGLTTASGASAFSALAPPPPPPTGVPEPWTLSLFGAGLTSAAALRRRARRVS